MFPNSHVEALTKVSPHAWLKTSYAAEGDPLRFITCVHWKSSEIYDFNYEEKIFYIKNYVQPSMTRTELELAYGKQFDVIDPATIYCHTSLTFPNRQALEEALALLLKENLINPLQTIVKGNAIFLSGEINQAELNRYCELQGISRLTPAQATPSLKAAPEVSSGSVQKQAEISDADAERLLREFLQAIIPEPLLPCLQITPIENAWTITLKLQHKDDNDYNELSLIKTLEEGFELLVRMAAWRGVDMEMLSSEQLKRRRFYLPENHTPVQEIFYTSKEKAFDWIKLLLPTRQSLQSLTRLFDDPQQTGRLQFYLLSIFNAAQRFMADLTVEPSNGDTAERSLVLVNTREIQTYQQSLIQKTETSAAVDLIKLHGEGLSTKQLEQWLKGNAEPQAILPALIQYASFEVFTAFLNNYFSRLDLNKTFSHRPPNLNVRYPNQISPLLLAVIANKVKFAQLLLAKGADANQFFDRETFFGCENDKSFENIFYWIIDLFLQRQADFSWIKLLQEWLNKKKIAPHTYAANRALEHICRYRYKDLAELATDPQEVDSRLLTAAQLCLALGADVNYIDFYPLIYTAVSNGHFKISDLLIEKGADINAPGEYKDSGSALDIIIEHITDCGKKSNYSSNSSGNSKDEYVYDVNSLENMTRYLQGLIYLLDKNARTLLPNHLKKCLDFLKNVDKNPSFLGADKEIKAKVASILEKAIICPDGKISLSPENSQPSLFFKPPIPKEEQNPLNEKGEEKPSNNNEDEENKIPRLTAER